MYAFLPNTNILIRNFVSEYKATVFSIVTQWFSTIFQVDSPIYNTAAGMCLGVDRAVRGEPILMVICDNQSTNQWDFIRT